LRRSIRDPPHQSRLDDANVSFTALLRNACSKYLSATVSGSSFAALGVILADTDAMLRRRACALRGELKELLLTFVDSLDGTKEQQRRVEEFEQSGLGYHRAHLGEGLGSSIGDHPKAQGHFVSFYALTVSLSRTSGTNGSTFSASNEPSFD
jgi:hypothetical protein